MPCYNNIYLLISLLYALSHIVLSTKVSRGGLILSTTDIDTSNHIGVDNNDRFHRRYLDIHISISLTTTSFAYSSSS